MTILISAVPDSGSLLGVLRGIDVTVPRSGANRKEQVERAVICHLLTALANAESLACPLTLVRRERPDFLITAGEMRIGAEVTEAFLDGYRHYVAVAEKEFPDEEFPDLLLEPGHFRWGGPERTPAEVGELSRQLLAQDRLTARPYYGNELEQQWAAVIRSKVDGKLDKLKHPEFEKCDENWLAIYDNLPICDRVKAIALLQPMLSDLWVGAPRFDVIFIQGDTYVLRITPDSSEWLTLNNLWG